MNNGDASLLLDLLNSRIVWPDGARDELDDVDAHDWLLTRGGTGSADEIVGAREAREVLADVIRGKQHPDAFAPWVSAMRKRAVLDGTQLGWVWDVDDRHLIGARAIEEWASLQAPSGSRVRECADPACQHFLVDRSASNRRKWHSMELCGNRTKARRHYARSKGDLD